MLVGALVPGAEQVRDRCSKPRSITITGFQVALTSETVSNHVLAKLEKKKKKKLVEASKETWGHP